MGQLHFLPHKQEEEHHALIQISRALYERPLMWKVGILSICALFLSTNVVAGFFSQDTSIETSFLNADEVVNFQPTASSGNGFLVKPSLQTSDGKRTGVNDILKYTVKSGDTISRIASRFNITSETILSVNNLNAKDVLRQGQELTILPVDGLLYKVQKDDSLEKVAQKFNIEKSTIIAQNKIENDALAVDKEIIIPGAKKVSITPPALPKNVPSQTTTRFASLSFNPSDKVSKKTPAVQPETNGFAGQLAWPVAGGGKISQRFSYSHPAIDITYDNGVTHPSIIAADEGVVVEAEQSGWNGGYGNVIVIDHGNGIQTRYAHNSEVYVSVGDHVKRGQVIGKMGNTGRVYGKTGIHSHFEVIVNGKRVNPLLYY
jgi:murein DD-endopeptidase MepM/ murein hydrolase activator NlpD